MVKHFFCTALALISLSGSTLASDDGVVRRAKGSKATVSATKRKIGCRSDDIIYFGAKYAEFIDKMSNAAESLEVKAVKNLTQAYTDYATMVRTPEEEAYVEYMEDLVTDDFSANFQIFKRHESQLLPSVTLEFKDLSTWITGGAKLTTISGVVNNDIPGFYAFHPLLLGRFLNPNGGDSGYSYCDYKSGTARTTIRTIDVFVGVDSRSDSSGIGNEDGNFDTESFIARIDVDWEMDERGWGVKKMNYRVNGYGFTSYN